MEVVTYRVLVTFELLINKRTYAEGEVFEVMVDSKINKDLGLHLESEEIEIIETVWEDK